MSAEAVAAKPAKKPAPRVLIVQRMPQRSSAARIEWDVTVSSETTLEDLLTPNFWSHVAGSTFNGPNNKVDVHWEDRTKFAELYVRQYTKVAAKMEVLHFYEFDKNASLDIPEDYAIDWTGPYTKYRILRKEDAQVLKDGFSSQEEAIAYLKDYKNLMK